MVNTSALAGFWDPTQSTLKSSILLHHLLISDILLALDALDDTNRVEVQCSQCATMVRLIPEYVNGDPRNQAVVLHEWWPPHSTLFKHSIAAITVAHGCMS